MATALLSEQDEKRVVAAIAAAEKNTSGEIRVHIENICNGDAVKRATQLFAKLKMNKTELQNGVLIYLAEKSKKFAIIGDKGIHAKVGTHFWDSTKAIMEAHFRAGNFSEGLVTGINEAGLKLKEFFPYKDDDTNELSNDISYGK